MQRCLLEVLEEEALSSSIPTQFGKCSDVGKPFTDWKYPAILRDRLSAQLGAVDARSVQTSFVWATGIVVVMNLDG
jgi:hypothetical protein